MKKFADEVLDEGSWLLLVTASFVIGLGIGTWLVKGGWL